MFGTYLPSKFTESYIAFFYTIKCQRSDYANIISEFCLPSGFAHMGFHLHGSFYVVQNNKKQKLHRFYTVGQQTHNYYFNSDSDKVELYGVTFKPTGLYHLFELDMPTITDKAIPTTHLFKSDLQKFTEQFDSEQEISVRLKLIENLFIDKLLSVQPQLNIIDSAIKEINETYGCCSISELTSKLGVSERYFQKNFKKNVGITPTSYKRIVRFKFMFAEIKTDTPIDCKALSAIYNYYDFSHFSKDFKKYCGACPSKFHIDKFKFLQELMASRVIREKPR